MTLYRKNSENDERRSSHLGVFGEDSAAEFLKLRGYRIIAKNFKTVIGRNRKGVALTGEIDLIALIDETVCFVEVKTRSDHEATPESAVTMRKQRQITRTARAYMDYFQISGATARFDVIAVVNHGAKAPRIEHLTNYWSADKCRKRRWKGGDLAFR